LFSFDPGTLEGFQFIELTHLGSDLHPARLGWFCMVLWPQQKCGGTDRIAPADMWVVARDYNFCLKFENLAGVLDIVVLIAKVSTGQLRLLMSQAARLHEEFPMSMSIENIILDHLVMDAGSPLLCLFS
jgi:hypothetical protein